MNVTGGPDMTLFEVNEAASVIHDAVADEAEFIFGAVVDDRIQGEVQITIIATGFELKNGEVSPTTSIDNRMPGDIFRPFPTMDTKGGSIFPLGVPSNEDKKPDKNPGGVTLISKDLDIPEFLNPKNRL